jgi:Arc/MetJ-type ribon-helix-helix transcriptional regulator
MKRGIYKSRNEAIRALVEEGLQVKLGEDEDVTQIVDRLLALRKKGEIPIRFKSRKTAAEMVAEGRQ